MCLFTFSPAHALSLLVPTGCYATPDTVSIQPLIFIEVAILISVVLIILVVIALASAGPFIRRLVFCGQIKVNHVKVYFAISHCIEVNHTLSSITCRKRSRGKWTLAKVNLLATNVYISICETCKVCHSTVCRMQVKPLYQTVAMNPIGSLKCAV